MTATEPPDLEHHTTVPAAPALAAIGLLVVLVVALALVIIFDRPDGATVVQPGEDLAAAIADAPEGGLLELGAGDHGNRDLSNLDARGVTVRCQDGADVNRFKLMRVTGLRLEACTMTPSSSDVGVYMSGGGDLEVSGFTITGGAERGMLVQAANKANRADWTVGANLHHNRVADTLDDAFAVYGGDGITIADNVVTWSNGPDGCNVAHSDGTQINGAVNTRILDNTYTGGSPGPPNMTCPAGDYPHDQGGIVTSRGNQYPEDVAESVYWERNTFSDWWSGLAALVDGLGTKDVRLIDTTFICSSRTSWKLTGNTSQVTQTGTKSVPCGRSEMQDIER